MFHGTVNIARLSRAKYFKDRYMGLGVHYRSFGCRSRHSEALGVAVESRGINRETTKREKFTVKIRIPSLNDYAYRITKGMDAAWRFLVLSSFSLLLIAWPAASHGQQQWNSQDSGTTETLLGVAYGNGVFVAVGEAGTILRSTDYGLTWQNRSNEEVTVAGLRSVAFGNNLFMAIAGDDVVVSTDLGLTWNRATVPVGWWTAVIWGGGSWFLVSESEIVSSESNGQSWTSVYKGHPALSDIVYHDGSLVAVGGSIYSSKDLGETWKDAGIPGADWLAGVTFGNNLFVVVGGNFGDVILKSSDPMKWSSDNMEVLPNAPGLSSVGFGNEVFVAVCNSGRILVSSGTGPWQEVTSGTDKALIRVAFGNGTFVVVGQNGTLLTSGHAPEIDSLLTANGTVGVPFNYTITSKYGASSFDAAGLPQDLSVNPATGIIDGTPATAGVYSVTLSADNAYGSDSKVLQLTIAPAGTASEFKLGIYTAIELEIPTKADKSYQIQTSPDLKAWTDFEAPITGTGSTLYRLYSTRDPNKRFYRATEQ
jgi:photosystem II stability/assembly factor-like uncharacterized protein